MRSAEVAHAFRTLWDAGAIGRASDAELLDRFAAGRDEAAFAALVDRHGAMVRGLCAAILSDPHEAQDASQATFLVLARRAGSIRRGDAVGS